jgi:AraC-like DNA-binding protein
MFNQFEFFLAEVIEGENHISVPVNGLSVVNHGWYYEDRSIADHIFYYVENGTMEGKVEGKPIEMSKGSCFWMTPFTKHSFRIGKNTDKTKVIHMRFNICTKIRLLNKVFSFDNAPELLPVYKETHEKLKSHSFEELRIKTLFANLILSIFDYSQLYKNSVDSKKLNPIIFNEIQALIDSDPAKQWSVKELSKKANLSMDYFTQLFRALVGVSPKSWLLQQKLKRGATMLLESSESISSLSDVLGFSDIYHFSRCFKTQYGLSPKAWRNKKAQ